MNHTINKIGQDLIHNFMEVPSPTRFEYGVDYFSVASKAGTGIRTKFLTTFAHRLFEHGFNGVYISNDGQFIKLDDVPVMFCPDVSPLKMTIHNLDFVVIERWDLLSDDDKQFLELFQNLTIIRGETLNRN